jgi:hypothetical protein
MEKDVESLTDLANEIQPEHVGHMPVIGDVPQIVKTRLRLIE